MNSVRREGATRGIKIIYGQLDIWHFYDAEWTCMYPRLARKVKEKHTDIKLNFKFSFNLITSHSQMGYVF